jgi:tRNA(Ile)-lysidine synthetase-like protein
MSLKQHKPDPRLKKSRLEKPSCPVTLAVGKNLPHQLKSLLLAVSGGVDSMVLMHAALKLAQQRKFHLYVAHVDHKLRNSSGIDASFVCVSATKSKIPFYLLESNFTPSANIEEWGRNLRYGFFTNLLSGLKIDAVATAHSASDNVELFLMQMFSNKIISSMASYEPRRKIYRPLIDVTRKQIETYAKNNDIKWIEDESNKSDKYLRNRVRNRLIPLLNNIFDGDVESTIRDQIVRYAKLQTAAKDGVLDLISTASQEKFGTKSWMGIVKTQVQSLEGHALKVYTEELLYPQIRRRLGDNWPERLKGFFLGNSAQIQLPGSVTIRRKHGGIELTQSDRPTKL